jgi:alkyl hydroperoxide reductase subunit AhpC
MSRPTMTDDELRHLCKLASIGVSSLRDPDFIRWLAWEADEKEIADFRNIFGIIGDAFTELARRQGMLPTFRVQAGRRPETAP